MSVKEDFERNLHGLCEKRAREFLDAAGAACSPAVEGALVALLKVTFVEGLNTGRMIPREKR